MKGMLELEEKHIGMIHIICHANVPSKGIFMPKFFDKDSSFKEGRYEEYHPVRRRNWRSEYYHMKINLPKFYDNLDIEGFLD